MIYQLPDAAYNDVEDPERRARLRAATSELLMGSTHLCRRRCEPARRCACRDELRARLEERFE